jgi:hypothetical protein
MATWKEEALFQSSFWGHLDNLDNLVVQLGLTNPKKLVAFEDALETH